MGTGRGIAERAELMQLAGRDGRTRRWDLLPTWVRWLPGVLVVLALALEIATPSRYSFASLLTAAVVLAALLSRPVVTVVIGVLCIVMLVSMHLALADVYPENVTGPVITLVLVTGFATVLATVLERTTLQLVQVQAVAEATQRALLRPLPPRLGPVRLAGTYRAADEAALIGGDFYSVRATPYGVRVVVGDVRGKGIGATETVATVTSVFREAATWAPTLTEVADRIELAMARDRADVDAGVSLTSPGRGEQPGGWAGELFATAVLLEFPEEGGYVRVLDRGHPPLVRLGGRDGVTQLNSQHALPLGFGDLAREQATVRSYRLTECETLVAYSDGVTEARSRDGRFYPLVRRLEERYGDGSAREHQGAGDIDPAEVVAFIQKDVRHWAESVNDDMVIVVLQNDSRAAP